MAEKIGRARGLLIVVWVASAFSGVALTGPADASTYGQIGEAWGKPGTGAGQFFKPGVFGVDPTSGEVYAGDMNSAATKYRIQQFTKTGELTGSAEIARKDEATGKLLALAGVAVDPIRQRFYLLESCKVPFGSLACSGTFGEFAALRIHAFKTSANEGKLESAGTFAMPAGEKELYGPTSIAVDPSNGDLVLLGEADPEEQKKGPKVVQRVNAAGPVSAWTLGERFVDSSEVLKPGGLEPAKSLAVGPGGTTYLLTGASTESGATATRAWQLPAVLAGVSEPTAVPGFAAAAESEEWPLGLIGQSGEGFYDGPGIAISPDGSTLYWKERYPGTETVPESVLVRGYSLTEGKTRVLYGGGATSCVVRTLWAGIGAAGEGAGEELLAFDYGPEQSSPPYGPKVVRFGRGGSGCPSPVAKFSLDGVEGDGLEVERGDSVSFDASASELELSSGGEEGEAFLASVVWKFGDGQEAVVRCREEGGECVEPAAITVSHEYATAGEFTVTLEMKLLAPVFGNPQPVQHTLAVRNPRFALSVFKAGTGTGVVRSAPAGIDCGEACVAEFESGKVVTLTPEAGGGSEFTGWSGACTGTGSCEVAIGEARSVTARFDLEEGEPPPSEFQLTVLRTGAGAGTVSSSPVGIACGEVCAASFQSGLVVTLAPVAGPDSEFTGWSGACSGTGSCEIAMDEAKSAGADFEPEAVAPPPRYTLTVVRAGSGSGTVASSRAGIYCGSKCEKEYEEGETVTLIPTAASGSRFAGWSGAGCAGTGLCNVSMNAAKKLTAAFEAIPPPAGEAPPAAAPQATPPAAEPKPHLTARQKALRRCGKLKGGKRARCIRKVNGKRGHGKRRRAHRG
jgi:hypothetical protein